MSGDHAKEKAARAASADAADHRSAAAAAGAVAEQRPVGVTAVAILEPDTQSAVHTAPSPDWQSPRNLWQGPAILLSIVLISWGLYVGKKPPAVNDFEGALTQVEQWIDAGELDRAAAQLRVVIEPNLARATDAQRARFAASVADYLYLTSVTRNLDDPSVLRRVSKQYATATDQGLQVSAARLERWAEADMGIGRLKDAQTRLAELDRRRAAERDPAAAASLATVRTRVFRRLIEAMVAHSEYVMEDLMALLADFRLDRGLSASDEVWAIARQTDVRLRAGQARQAVDVLLVEMRRLENRSLPGEAAAGAIGELYTLLGRGYVELGEYDRAISHLDHALTLFTGPEPARGDALAMLGQIALSTGSPDAAMDHFQLVVRDFIATPSYLPALLGRAEVFSILGDHESSISDYRLLADTLEISMGWRDGGTGRQRVKAGRVSESLCDRHDSAVALGKVESALDYVELAESLFDQERVPADVLFRLAATNRQLADDLMAQAQVDTGRSAVAMTAEMDPAIRREVNRRYERAGDYFLRHFNADLTDLGATTDEAATSLWLAADCFDLGGRQDLAIQNFTKYLDMQPIDDPRRAHTLFRLAHACQAVAEFERAIEHYEQLVADRSRSSYAARAYVPLARCYVAMNRASEARQLLQQVLAGGRLLQPDASDYRDALLELGRIEYHADSYTPAIEHFAEFLQRYPDDTRVAEVRYLMADSYRASARQIGERAAQDASMPPSEVGRLNAIRDDQLRMALDLFGQVGESIVADATGKAADYQQDIIRRAALYRADCAFQLREFSQAIGLYDHAARQYSDHQSSMYALIQIVNAYNAIGDSERAAAAHHRALVRLKQLPEEAFQPTEALMDRAAWEQWLESNPVLPARTAAAPTG